MKRYAFLTIMLCSIVFSTHAGPKKFRTDNNSRPLPVDSWREENSTTTAPAVPPSNGSATSAGPIPKATAPTAKASRPSEAPPLAQPPYTADDDDEPSEHQFKPDKHIEPTATTNKQSPTKSDLDDEYDVTEKPSNLNPEPATNPQPNTWVTKCHNWFTTEFPLERWSTTFGVQSRSAVLATLIANGKFSDFLAYLQQTPGEDTVFVDAAIHDAIGRNDESTLKRILENIRYEGNKPTVHSQTIKGTHPASPGSFIPKLSIATRQITANFLRKCAQAHAAEYAARTTEFSGLVRDLGELETAIDLPERTPGSLLPDTVLQDDAANRTYALVAFAAHNNSELLALLPIPKPRTNTQSTQTNDQPPR